MIKKVCLIFLIISIISVITIPASAAFRPDFIINSEGAYMINLDTGDVIIDKNSDAKMYPASTTKIMTAIVTIEYLVDHNIDLTTAVKAPSVIYDEFYGDDVSNADIWAGENVRYIDLLYAMMLRSACEAASILAYHVGGESVSSFVEMMNAKAKALGCENTHFTNPHGLFNADQYTTAKDLATIARYAYDLPRFMDFCGVYTYEMPATNVHGEPRIIAHTNMLMNKNSEYYYEYAKGMKTGTIDEAGRCLVSTASKDGFRYLTATLKAPMYDADGNKLEKQLSFVDHKALYEWAFSTFDFVNIISMEEDVMEVKVEQGKDKDFVKLRPSENKYALLPKTLDKDTIQRIKPEILDLIAPVVKGTELGFMELRLSGETIATVALVTAEDVELSKIALYMNKAQEMINTSWFKAAVIMLAGLLVIYIAARAMQNSRKKRQKAAGKNRKYKK